MKLLILNADKLKIKMLQNLNGSNFGQLRKNHIFFIANRSKTKGNSEKGLEKVKFLACGAEN